ncbi:MAG: endonuclease/exonuclease/phosphatase family protein [Desulfobacteraceae bacterium]
MKKPRVGITISMFLRHHVISSDFFIKVFMFISLFIFIPSSGSTQSLSVMTWNTGDSNRTIPKASDLYDVIIRYGKKPDILILQEIFYNNYSDLKKKLNYRYGIHSSEISPRMKNLAVLSSHELFDHELIVFSNNVSGALKTEIRTNDSENLKIYSVHLEYIKKKTRDDSGFVNLKLKEIIDIFKKEISAENPRKAEAKKLLDQSGKPGKKTILAGDFNTVSFSSSIRRIKKYYCDAMPFFKLFSSGTYRKIHFPFKPRIDYIFHSPDLNIESFEVIKSTPGDHYPVSASIKY